MTLSMNGSRLVETRQQTFEKIFSFEWIKKKKKKLFLSGGWQHPWYEERVWWHIYSLTINGRKTDGWSFTSACLQLLDFTEPCFIKHCCNWYCLAYFTFGVPTAMKYTSLRSFCYVAMFPGMSFREVSSSFEFHFEFSTCKFYLQRLTWKPRKAHSLSHACEGWNTGGDLWIYFCSKSKHTLKKKKKRFGRQEARGSAAIYLGQSR